MDRHTDKHGKVVQADGHNSSETETDITTVRKPDAQIHIRHRNKAQKTPDHNPKIDKNTHVLIKCGILKEISEVIF